MDSLNTFKDMSGLVPSLSKSTAFFCNVSESMRGRIRQIMPFEVGALPVRYLGVPLISTRLIHQDCAVLVEKLDNRIMSWRNRYLSFAGRIQLIRSVLSSMHIFWASVFILPGKIVHLLERKMRSFLWDSGGSGKGKAKVPWKIVCLPKEEGGLGVRRIEDMNKALITSHIWSIVSRRNSLWVTWTYAYRIKDRNFWEIPCRGVLSWGWRKILQHRHEVRDSCRIEVGDGKQTSMWYDKWLPFGHLGRFLTPRNITNAGYSLSDTVAKVCERTDWDWPQAWRDLYPVLITATRPILADKEDSAVWIDMDGNVTRFSVSSVWNRLRTRGDRVNWFSAVWFSKAIPRHSFICWLVMHRKLKTHDLMKPWEVGGQVNLNLLCCVLCARGTESHDHLFFQCSYSTMVWSSVRSHLNISVSQNALDSIVSSVCSRNPKFRVGYVMRLAFSATIYHLWRERNNRMFSNHARPPDVLKRSILEDVRLRMATTQFLM